MTNDRGYHEIELDIVRDIGHPNRLVPNFDCAGKTILDIGCGIGQTLTAIEFTSCNERYGIDIDADAIAKGSAMFPELQMQVAPAEALPFGDNMFDLTYSRVAIPYTNLSLSIAEMIRVTKEGGVVWILGHPIQMVWTELREAVRRRSIKRVIDRLYVLCNSLCFLVSWRCFARPLDSTFESVQFESNFRRFLEYKGLHSVKRLSQEKFCFYGIKGSQLHTIVI